MLETTKLPLTFGKAHTTSNADPLLERRRYEIRALSDVYIPEKATGWIEDDTLRIDYSYVTEERPAFAFESEPRFSVHIGSRTRRVLNLSVKATGPEIFTANIDACITFLKNQLGTASEQRHYLIIADSLEGFKQLILHEHYRE